MEAQCPPLYRSATVSAIAGPHITNFVVMNFMANVLLAVGASPVMTHALEEIRGSSGN